MGDRDRFYSGPDAFRCGEDPHLEVTPNYRNDGGVVISLDSFNAPELSLRLTVEQRRALAQFLLAE